jgi:hypothetical protein
MATSLTAVTKSSANTAGVPDQQVINGGAAFSGALVSLSFSICRTVVVLSVVVN